MAPWPLTVWADAGTAVATTAPMAITTLTAMRRSALTGLILACLLAGLLSLTFGVAAASAHPGATVFTIQVGAPTSISILVPADYGKPITEVDITDPSGFTLDDGEPPPGWTVRRAGATLVFAGGQIEPTVTGFAVFAVRGEAPAKGELLFPITTRSPDGTVMRYDGQVGAPNQGAIVYAGITPHLASRKGFPWLRAAGGGVLAVGLVGTGVLLWRRRRPHTGEVMAGT